MNNKTLAEELLTRCAGIPSPYRGLIQEAARRLLQMCPDAAPVTTKIPEAKSLRWLANMWPLIEKPQDDADKMSTCIHLYCTAAADRIEQMAETIDYARMINSDNVRLTAELEKLKQEREVLRVENLNMASLVEQLMEIKKERDSMAAALKNRGCCDTCRHCDIEWDQHPCDSCRQDPNYPSWEWKGE